MRYGILTDVHSNTEALRATLDVLHRQNVDAIIHMGDVVGYGAEPNACCALLRKEAKLSLMGNHDAAVAGLIPLTWFSHYARTAIEWTLNVIEDSHRDWLAASPYTFQDGEYLFSHGSPISPGDFRYVFSRGEADGILAWMDAMGVRVVFVGHAHQCLVFGDTGAARTINGSDADMLDLGEGRWIVNVGSVGQPRDGDPRACCAVVDTDTGRYEVFRCAYNIDTAAAKIYAAGLPDILSDRLAIGR